jgi:WD40 repeat protein
MGNVSFSPDGKTLAVTFSYGTGTEVAIWDIPTGKSRTIPGLADTCWNATFSADGRLFVPDRYREQGQQIKAWDVATGKVVKTINLSVPAFQIVLSPDGKIVACTGEQGKLRLLDARTTAERAVLQGPKDGIGALAFSADGKQLAFEGEDGAIKVWDVAAKMERVIPRAHTGSIRALAFRPDGKALVSGCMQKDKNVKVWDPATGKELAVLNQVDELNAAAFAPDGKTLVTAHFHKGVRLWDGETWEEKCKLLAYADGASDVSISRDGKRLAVGYFDGTTKVFDMENNVTVLTPVSAVPFSFDVALTSFVADGTKLAVATMTGEFALLEPASGKKLDRRQQFFCKAVSPDGKIAVGVVAGENGVLELRELASDKKQAVLKGHEGFVNAAVFSPDGKTLATSDVGSTLIIWDVDTGKEIARKRGEGPTFSADSKLLMARDNNGVKVWDLSANKPVVEVEVGATSAALAPDPTMLALGGGMILSGGGGTTELWSIAEKKGVRTLYGHATRVQALAFSADGKWLATAADFHRDYTVKDWKNDPREAVARLWDVRTGKAVAILHGHQGRVATIAFSPDGRSLATGCSDRGVRIFDLSRLSKAE